MEITPKADKHDERCDCCTPQLPAKRSETAGRNHVPASRSTSAIVHARTGQPDPVRFERLGEESCALTPLATEPPRIIGRRGLTDFLGDLCVATDDLNS
jgi:hypothetical protein